MSGQLEDVEALLESTAKDTADSRNNKSGANGQHKKRDSHDRRDDRTRETSRDRERRMRDRSRERRNRERRGTSRDDVVRSPRSDRYGRRRSRSREGDRHRSRRDYDRSGGDYYRGGGRPRGRSRSPDDDRFYRPSSRRERDPVREHDDFIPLKERGERDRESDRPPRRRRDDKPRSRSPKNKRSSKTPEQQQQPPLTEDERDRRTVFVQQLAARLKTRDLEAFFEKVGPVKEAQIVKDRVSGRSKGVGYVEFKNEESVQPAIQLTGQKLLGIPIIAQLTEAEKNRLARNSDNANGNTNSIPFHRLYVGNIHFSITEDDLATVFKPFGELEFVQLQKEDQGRSRGYGFVQFHDPAEAKEALEKMNGFELAGRPIRVGLGNDKFTPESTQTLLQKFGTHAQNGFQGSSFSGAGGRGSHAGGPAGNFDRVGGRDDKAGGGASALDDTDVGGVNFNNYNREALMKKLARTEDEDTSTKQRAAKSREQAAKPMTQQLTASRCLQLKGMFDPNQEEGSSWIKELEDDVRFECEEKYGHVVHIAVDPNSQGDIYIAFDRVQGGDNALKGLNGRFFGGNMISATPVVEAVYKSQFPKAL